MISPAEALERLRAGNRRFVAGKSNILESIGQARRAELVEGQSPFAVILACSDSRVPVELVFDQGLGDLFVIRVAGNVVSPSQIGSVEFAASQLGSRLVVVLGHSNCGAVEATLKELAREQESRSPNLRAIVERIKPAVEPLLASGVTLQGAVSANVRYSVQRLQYGSAILEQLIAEDELKVVGAEYSIESGEVAFFDD
ncbi:MAG: carbonic anhydrase [Gammaproteobacteria bacterium]|nr:carbonic anhydrase [Gammaproteobacteria bacterium]NNF49469.1 carbonic anhydrase [Woeseiaceae bacterium]MBT8093875.1 carbonic anhydrase [Gammaproteobacteria bacterium]MBT8105934.1 carbonic anhydrase [Gammaproteobacteria bacterium]NNK25948.1 carbonic anhydrase [Woeseiaceae bacterium]